MKDKPVIDSVTIPDCEGRGFIKLESAKFDDYWITVQVEGASVRAKSDNYPGGDGLPQFFEAMAKEWRGWKGTRDWKSPMGGFSLEADHDGRGHVALEINFGPAPDGWRFTATLQLAPGELEGIAIELREMFKSRQVSKP